MTDSTRTDPRFHPAYQRGYQGQGAPSASVAPAEERFRRPRGADAAQGRRRSTAPEAVVPSRVRRPGPARLSEPSSPPVTPALPSGSAVVEPDAEQAPIDEIETQSGPAVPRRPSALDRRIPIALAVLGVLFLVSGVGLIWSATSSIYQNIGVQRTEFDQFVGAITNYLAGPAITIGLLSIGAAIALRAARS